MPFTKWLTEKLSAVGWHSYSNENSRRKILDSAVARYKDEKYALYELEQRTLDIIEEFAMSKLDAWNYNRRIIRIFRTVEHKPASVVYYNHKNLRLSSSDIGHLFAACELVDEMHAKNLDKIGPGILSAIVLHGGASTMASDDGGKSILENLVDIPVDSKNMGRLEELAMFNKMMCFPVVLDDKSYSLSALKDLDKEHVIMFKARLDAKSLDLADANGRVKRINETLEYVYHRFTVLRQEQIKVVEQLEDTIEEKTSYTEFTPKEKTLFSYGLALLFAIRKLAKTDIINSNGNISVLNYTRIRDVLAQSQDLIPEEELQKEQAKMKHY
jgi:hypothetical protein